MHSLSIFIIIYDRTKPDSFPNISRGCQLKIPTCAIITQKNITLKNIELNVDDRLRLHRMQQN